MQEFFYVDYNEYNDFYNIYDIDAQYRIITQY